MGVAGSAADRTRPKVVRYELGARLAVGGMAEVFLATAELPTGERRPLVVKRILPQFSDDPAFIKMFLDEATITGRLDHPNIVALVDMGRIDDQLFIALEYVPGMDLEELVLAVRERGERLPLEIAFFILGETLRALHHAHTRTTSDGRPLEIVHRDVTAGNVLLSLEGEVKLGDFGIAKAAVRHAGTSAGVIKGNFQFMAPEQVTGQVVDHRADVYGAGMVLRMMLTGQLPFDAGNVPLLIDRVVRGEVPPVASVVPETPAAVDALVRQATARLPSERFPTAEAFRRALEACARACGAVAGPRELSQILHEVRRGRDDLRLLGSGRSEVLERSGSEPNEISVFRTHVSHAGRLPPLADDAPTIAGFRPSVAEPASPSAGIPPPPFGRPKPRFRSATPAPRALPSDPETTKLSPGSALPAEDAPDVPTVETDTSPDLPASVSAAGGVPEVPTKETTVPPAGDPTADIPTKETDLGRRAAMGSTGLVPGVSPEELLASLGTDPGWAAGTGPREVEARRVKRGTPVLRAGPLPAPLIAEESVRIPAHRQSVSAVVFAGSATLVSGGNDQTLRVWDVTRATETACLRGHTGAITCVAAGTGGTIVSGSRDKTARVWKLGELRCAKTLVGHAGWVFTVAVSGDGLLAASGGVDKSIRLWDLSSGEPRRVLDGHRDTVSALAFLPDGRLLSASYDQTLRLWRLDGAEEQVMGGKIGTVRAVAVSADGKRVVSAGADGKLRAWNVGDPAPELVLSAHTGPVVALAFVPGSPLLASASYDGTARLWDLAAGAEVASLALDGAVTAIAPAHSGGFLAMGNGDGSLALWAPR